jgi:hypothetical protein
LWDRDRQGQPIQPGELTHHSDAGSQYTSIRFSEHLALEGIAPSIGTVGDAYDNALMETVIGLFKTECVATTVFHPGPYKTLADVEYATAGWVDWYNHRRLHGTLGMLTPAEYEQAHYAASSRSNNPNQQRQQTRDGSNPSPTARPPPPEPGDSADLDQLDPDPLDQAVDPLQCSPDEETASQQCVRPTFPDRVPARKPPKPARTVSPRRPPDAELAAEH